MLETIQNLNEEIRDKIAGINYGGCGIFSYYTAKVLLNTNVDFKIWHSWCGDKDSVDINGNHELFKVKNYKGINFHKIVPYHIFIYLPKENFYFDGENISETPDGLGYAKYNKEYPRDLNFLKFSIDRASWNPNFNRKQIPELKEIINKNLSHLIIKKETSSWSIKQLFTAFKN